MSDNTGSNTGEQNASLEAVKDLLDKETNAENAKLLQYLREAMDFLIDQKKIFGLDPTVTTTTRERNLIEKLAAGIYNTWNRPEHSTKTEELAKSDIKTHIRSVAQKHSDDGVAGGGSQFLKTTGNVRDGNGL